MIDKAEQVIKFWNKTTPNVPNIFRVFWNFPEAEREGNNTTLEITDLSYKVLLSQQKLSNEGVTEANEEVEEGSLESDATKSKAYSLKNDIPTPVNLGKRLSFNLPNHSLRKPPPFPGLPPQKQLKKR